MTNFIVMGDSWGCGEWGLDSQGQYRVLHTGINQYLQEKGHLIYTLAQGSASNQSQVDLLQYQSTHATVIWFLTDPLRDINANTIATTLQSYQDQRNTLLRAQFARTCSWHILLLGGVCSVPEWVSAEFPHIRTLCSKLQSWLIPGSQSIDIMNRLWPYSECKPDLLEYFEQQELALQRHIMRATMGRRTPEHKWFWPDGQHLNRHAHLKITQELVLSACGLLQN